MTKSILFYFCGFGICSTHAHQHAQPKEKSYILWNSRKSELISISSFLPRPKEDFLTIQVLKEVTSIWKCLVGSSDRKCSDNHMAQVISQWQTAAWLAFGEVSARQFSPKNANSSVQMLERWIFKSKFISSYIQRTLTAHC